MKEEKIITYGSGITTKPSDFLCKDGELAECINLTSDMEELKVMAQPVATELAMQPGEKLLFVHDHPDGKCYVSSWVYSYGGTNYTRIHYRKDSSLSTTTELTDLGNDPYNVGSNLHLTAVGKTLIASDSNGLHYWLWKGDGYEALGSKIPEPDVWFKIVERNTLPKYVGEFGDYTDIFSYDSGNHKIKIEANQRKDATDLVMGLYYSVKKKVQRNKGFCEPFFARYALELYDGSYTYISNPVLMYPSVSENCYFEINSDILKIYGHVCHLWYRKKDGDYSKWSDIVKRLVVFVSKPISLYEDDPDFSTSDISTLNGFINGYYFDNSGGTVGQGNCTFHKVNVGSSFSGDVFNILKERSSDSKLGDLRSSSVFYKLCELGLENTSSYINTNKHIGEYVLENIETQQQLKVDDYFSRCPLTPGYAYSYNQRLHLASVERGFFKGFKQCSCAEDSTEVISREVFVYINTPTGTKRVSTTFGPTHEKFGAYFYYPDPRAIHANTGGTHIKLEEHPGLNGAYSISTYPDGTTGAITPDQESAPSSSSPATTEKLDNRVLVSEVSNPFVFPAAGDVTVGSGKVIAMATQTVALSQGQFGQFPLLVFCSDGIWALTVGDDGTYLSAKPKSRDVLLYEQGLIETDGAVYFISKKGLMVIGEQVMLMSAHMDGKLYLTSNIAELQASAFVQDQTQGAPINDKVPWGTIVTTCASGTSFLAFVRSDSCRMAYDYIGSRLLLINPSYGYVFVYNMKDGSISKQVITAGTMKYAVRDYPDYLIHGEAQTGNTATVLSLYGQSDEASDSTRQYAFLLTRPMKLGGGVTVKSLRELQHVGSWETRTTDGTNTLTPAKVKTEIWVSDDGNTWYKDNSRFGAAAKMYRLALYLHLLPSERISGTVIRTQERRDGNLR